MSSVFSLTLNRIVMTREILGPEYLPYRREKQMLFQSMFSLMRRLSH
jgi:hypothetical protein